MDDLCYKWIETARLLRRKTQKEVAEEVGISQGKLSKAERGDQMLPADILKKLSVCYNIPLDFFYQEWDATPVAHIFFRRKVTIPSKIIDSISAEVRRRKCIIDNLMSAIDLPEYDLGYYPLKDGMSIDTVTENVRYKLRCVNGPLTDLSKRLENHGIIIQTFDFGTEKMDGLTTVTSHGRKVIFLNSQMPNDRIRFSLAHELGHLVMHLDDVPNEDRDVEKEADYFASQLLMPANEIRSQLYNLNVTKLIQLKQRWRVSMRALIRRAMDLGTISPDAYRNFQILFSKKGYNKNEPATISQEPSSVIKNVIKLYQDELGYNDAEMMQMMNLSPKDYYLWLESPRKPRFIALPQIR